MAQPAQPDLLDHLLSRFPATGRVVWIGLRTRRRGALVQPDATEALAGRGLAGDHRAGGAESNRQVTLVQAEHLELVRAWLGHDAPIAAHVRRNLVVAGINLHALRRARFRVGAALFEGGGDCHPCSRMEANLGPGGFNAMRGHGGIVARVLEGGPIALGDEVRFVERVRA